MLSAIIVFGGFCLLIYLLKTDSISNKKRKFIIHLIGVSIFLFFAIIGIIDMIEENFKSRSVYITIFSVFFFPSLYYITLWALNKKE